jgi:Ca2+-binding RTX toxin-like protein
MASSVTVSGSHNSTITLSFTPSANVQLARVLASGLSAQVANGTLRTASSQDGPPPPLPHAVTGEFLQTTRGLTFLPHGYDAVVDTGRAATISGSGDVGESVLGGTGGMTFIATGGSGTVAAGGGNNTAIVPFNDPGKWFISTGDGDDRIFALGSGNDTIQPGGGNNTVVLGDGNDLVQLAGTDTVTLGHGATTVDASLSHSTLVQDGSGRLTFVGGEGSATITGGSGSETVHGGNGRTVVHGGSDGHNLLFAGTGAATLFGGGSGDQLYAQGDRHQALHAGGGNETLSAALSTGNVTLYGGSGKDQMIAGSGNDIFVGGSGKDTFTFINGSAGGTDLILDFTKGDKAALSGYGPNAVADALASQTAGPGSVTITLSDSTKITFDDVSSLRKSDFS